MEWEPWLQMDIRNALNRTTGLFMQSFKRSFEQSLVQSFEQSLVQSFEQSFL